MTTPQIAGLYTPYVAQLLSLATPAAHHELRQYLRHRCAHHTLALGYEVRVRHFADQGLHLDQRCSARVFAWACTQLATTDGRPVDESWSAAAADFTTDKGAFVLRYGAQADFATLLRGLHHYQRKLDRHTNKQLAQLRSYHAQHLLALAMQPEPATAELVDEALAQPANGVLPRLVGGLRRRLAAKIHQVAVAAESIVLGDNVRLA